MGSGGMQETYIFQVAGGSGFLPNSKIFKFSILITGMVEPVYTS